MPRPGQAAARRQRKESVASGQANGHSDDHSATAPEGGAQVLPVAQLPDDFEGEPLDGATYLALVGRANKKLPFYTRVPQKEAIPAPVPPAPVASSSRHPALPQESWEVLFAAHFTAYRTSLAQRWPPSPLLPYPADYPPVPTPKDSIRWRGFVDGTGGWLPPKLPLATLEDEEEAMNGDRTLVGRDEEEEENGMVLDDDTANPETQQVAPREPLVSVLQSMDTYDIVRVLALFTRWMTTALDQLDDWDHDLESDGPIDPFPSHHARWAFALLAVLDSHLDRNQLTILRDFARACAAIGSWRWRAAIARGDELPVIPVAPGFFGTEGQATVTPMLGEVGGHSAPPPPAWSLGARWKDARDRRPRSEVPPRPESDGKVHDAFAVDENLGRVWICAHAVAAGWAQWDLLDDFRREFNKLPRP